MLIELVCQGCGRGYVPSREDVVRGPRIYRHCPPCRAAIIGSAAPKPGNEPAMSDQRTETRKGLI